MSWFGDIGETVGGWFGSSGGNILGGLASTALTGLALSLISKSINNSQSAPATATAVDTGVVVNIPPDTDQKIPVLYGSHHFAGIITEAVMSTDNKTMTYVITLCERTGNLLSTGAASQFTFYDIYWNNNRITFNSDGVTAHYTQDAAGNIDRNIDGLVKVWCFAGGSIKDYNQVPTDYTQGTQVNAWDLVPNWTTAHTMTNLVFAVVKVTYNKTNGITGLGNMLFHVTNSMTQPGDCLYDYMTNTRYGAGINTGDILV